MTRYVIYRRLHDGFWSRISRDWPTREQAERYAAALPSDWVIEIRAVEVEAA